MELQISDKCPIRHRKPVKTVPQRMAKRIIIKAGSFQNLFKEGLKGMAHELKSDFCSVPTHYDCTMHISVNTSDSKKLMVAFLSQVLVLTYAHRTIFSTMYVQELSEKKLEAQLYGNWFGCLDHQIKAIVENTSTLERKNDGLYTASLLLIF
ncbi:MAG: archease [Maribacter sp.]